MKNIEFQNILKHYPDDVIVYIDTTLGWNIPSNKNYVDPKLYTVYNESGDLEQIEIGPSVYPLMNLETINQIIDLMDIKEYSTSEERINLLKKFKDKYE